MQSLLMTSVTAVVILWCIVLCRGNSTSAEFNTTAEGAGSTNASGLKLGTTTSGNDTHTEGGASMNKTGTTLDNTTLVLTTTGNDTTIYTEETLLPFFDSLDDLVLAHFWPYVIGLVCGLLCGCLCCTCFLWYLKRKNGQETVRPRQAMRAGGAAPPSMSRGSPMKPGSPLKAQAPMRPVSPPQAAASRSGKSLAEDDQSESSHQQDQSESSASQQPPADQGSMVDVLSTERTE